MYLGEFAEVGSTEEVFAPPHHPYTEALLSAIPEPDPRWEGDRIHLSGNVPSPIQPPSGCRFHTRCQSVIQPEQYDLDQAVWRSLVDLKIRIAGAESIDAVTATESGHSIGLGLPGVSELPVDEFVPELREQLALDETTSDKRIKQEMRQVLDQVHSTATDDTTAPLPSPESVSLEEPVEQFCDAFDRSVVEYGAALETTFERIIERVRQLQSGTDDDGLQDPSELSLDELEMLLREEFELPERIPNGQIEDVLSRTIERIHEGDLAGASDTIRSRSKPARHTGSRVYSTTTHTPASVRGRRLTTASTRLRTTDRNALDGQRRSWLSASHLRVQCPEPRRVRAVLTG
jgi:oligopeptide/dipeptide ABC transporter ATP-binding protein